MLPSEQCDHRIWFLLIADFKLKATFRDIWLERKKGWTRLREKNERVQAGSNNYQNGIANSGKSRPDKSRITIRDNKCLLSYLNTLVGTWSKGIALHTNPSFVDV